ncbi:hypothetical protein HMPREF1624_03155 [Sporothrix schenckii ATCC 58251]|uniref:Uncharacterized protein n=1 Tax=Sporothrix schenckii (strain ATCC 58251 / de Perez 2211183) TaxID=1391915 RepID=U7PZ67_SPOS1|nr:hypothetical protein HMPREF1624_03155 [Sporothrix schenckii ATCC 58251]
MALLFLFSTVCTIIGFVLTVLGLFAGNTPGFMEEFSVIMLNTSALGRNYVPSLNQPATRDLSHVVVLADEDASVAASEVVVEVAPSPAKATTITNGDAPKTYSIQDERAAEAEAKAEKAAKAMAARKLAPRKLTLSAAEGVLAGMPADSAADDMAAVLGVSEFYSLHVMNVCEGTFAPNATADSAWRNVSSCTVQLNSHQLNISNLIDNELNDNFVDGGSLARLGGSSSLQSALNRIPTLGIVLAVFYIVAACFAGLGLLLTAASVVTRVTHSRETVLANLAAASGAALALLIAGLVSAVAAKSTVDSINRLGKDTIGMEACQGYKFEALTWAAFGLMTVAALFWLHELQADAKKAAAAAAAKKKAAAAAAPKK